LTIAVEREERERERDGVVACSSRVNNRHALLMHLYM
jgi:hypothetical protein